MKRLFLVLPIILFAAGLVAQESESQPIQFGDLVVSVLDSQNNELTPVPSSGVEGSEKGIEQTPLYKSGAVDVKIFKHDDSPIVVRSCVDPQTKIVMFRVQSPLLQKGNLSFGFNIHKEVHQPEVVIENNRVGIQCSKAPVHLGWNGPATAVPAKPKKKLKITLAEYGAEDRWKDVTKEVQKMMLYDSLDIRAGNGLFGDPAGGIVKSFILNYSLDDDELMTTFAENQQVRIQFVSKVRLVRLTPKGSDVFDFALRLTDKLPDELPEYDAVLKAAEKEVKEGPASKFEPLR